MQCCPADVLVSVSPLLPCLDDPILLRVGITSHKRPKLHVTQKFPKPTGIEDLPDEVVDVVLDRDFSSRDFCSLSQVSSRYRQLAVGHTNSYAQTCLGKTLKDCRNLQSSDKCWETAYTQQYGNITGVTRDAATLAKSWKELFRCKTVTEKAIEPRYGHHATRLATSTVHVFSLDHACVSSSPLPFPDPAVSKSRISPCSYELTAVLQRIAGEQAAATQTGGVVFLLDGSGSVSQGQCLSQFQVPKLVSNASALTGLMMIADDFDAMTDFVSKAVPIILEKAANSKVSIF